MKISKTAVLIGGFLTTGLGLTMGAPIDLYKDPSYAVQHISGVKIIESGNAVSSIVKHTGNLVNIETDNFILSRDEDSNKIMTGIYSSILGGSGNTITGDYSVIVGGENNKIEGGVGDSILGGLENKLKTGENSVIIGGENNVLEGNNSSIVGGTGNTVNGDYSVVVGNNSHVTGSYSVVMGQNSNLNANSSFLWTDGNHADTFTTDNVFAVIASGGMVINATRPRNDHTQLTLGGPLVLSENIETNNSLVCSGGKGGGIVKVVNSGDKVCMCSCDGYERSSLFGLGTCRSVCNPDIKPKCNTGIISKHFNGAGRYNYYSGGCDSGTVVDGAYFVDKYDVVHWSCQSDDGVILECTGSKIDGGGKEGCGGVMPTGEYIKTGASIVNSNNTRKQWKYVKKNNPGTCEWTCKNNSIYIQSGNTCVIGEFACKKTYPNNAITGSPTYTGNYKPDTWTRYTGINPNLLGACYFMCPIGYSHIGENCVDIHVQIECDSSTLPENASLNDPSKQPRNLNDNKCFHAPTSDLACSYHCNDGYMYDSKNNKCVQKTYKCEEPLPPENAIRGSAEYTTGHSPIKWQYTGSIPPGDGGACYWTCGTGTEYKNGNCESKSQHGICTGEYINGVPNNTKYPDAGEVVYYHQYFDAESGGENNDPCTYHCSAGYPYNPGTNTCEGDPHSHCGKTPYTCDTGSNVEEESKESIYLDINGGMIQYKWRCVLGTTREPCQTDPKELDCKHCAINGFPYCFPIDFRNDCNEGAWYLISNGN